MVTPVRRLALLLVAGSCLGLTVPSSAGAEPPGAVPASHPGFPGLRSAATWDYHYAAAETQQLSQDYARGASATFDVEHPGQVRTGHSLAEIAVESPAMDYSYIEAGWIVTPRQAPQLFIFWWDQGLPECYNQGCGYVAQGPGLQPGATLEPHTTLQLTWRHARGKWWLIVDGKRSGYYPDDQWTGDFTSTGFAQVFGEVAIKDGKPVCTDMGDGRLADTRRAAAVSDVSFVGGPAVTLLPDVDEPQYNYTLRLTSDTSMRYGGPGLC
jgi:neprosin-like protein